MSTLNYPFRYEYRICMYFRTSRQIFYKKQTKKNNTNRSKLPISAYYKSQKLIFILFNSYKFSLELHSGRTNFCKTFHIIRNSLLLVAVQDGYMLRLLFNTKSFKIFLLTL